MIVKTDCLTGLASLSEKSVRVVVTSPPYNIGLDYENSTDRKEDYFDWMQHVCAAIYRVLEDDGHFFLQMGGIASRPTIPWDVLTRAQSAGFVLQNEIVWVKNITVADESYGQFKPINSGRFLNNTHEFIFHLTKTGKIPVNRLAVGSPLKYKSNIARWNHKQSVRCRGNVWFIPYETIQSKADRGHHPATFPVALPEMCIKLAGFSATSWVVDPFLGTGTTLVACKRLGVRGKGFDISSEYCKIAEARLKGAL